MATRLAQESCSLLMKRGVITASKYCWVGWTPEGGWVKLNTDGAKKHINGMANARNLVWDEDGNWVVGFWTKIGNTTSYSAELWGLRDGLKLVKERGLNQIIIELDSEAVTKALADQSYSDIHGGTLLRDYRELLKSVRDYRINHTLREWNKCVDWLANQGQLREWGMTILEDPQDGIISLLQAKAGGALTYIVR